MSPIYSIIAMNLLWPSGQSGLVNINELEMGDTPLFCSEKIFHILLVSDIQYIKHLFKTKSATARPYLLFRILSQKFTYPLSIYLLVFNTSQVQF